MADGGDDGDDKKGEIAWERMMIRLVALRGDPEVEAFIEEKHAELVACAIPVDSATGEPPAAPDGTSAAESRENWFKRKLRTQCFEVRERRKLCKGLEKALRRYSEKYETPTQGAATDALKDGGAQEGPLICHQIAAGLAKTRFEGLRIARVRTGVYQFGPKLLVALQADEGTGGEILVHGYFDGDVLHPARVKPLAFLEEHSAAPPSDAGNDMFGGGGAVSAEVVGSAVAATGEDAEANGGGKRLRELPPGWEKRESRSKPGVFYYVHEAKGLSQFERPDI